MKGTITKRVLLLTAVLTLSGMFTTMIAQNPPSPPSHGQGGNQGAPGGGAALEGGLAVSLALIAGYGAWKTLRRDRKGK